MFRNYLKTALQNLKRNIVFTSINILGLSIALAVSFIILLFVINELSYNSCHKNRDSVYRVIDYKKDYKSLWAGTPYVLASTLKEEFPQVEKAINVRNLRGFNIIHKDDSFRIRRAVATSSDVFDVFTLPLLEGTNTGDLLEDKHAICLSRSLAEKLFSDLNVVGKQIRATINKKEEVLTVNAVFEDLPENSTFKAECFVNPEWNFAPLNKAFGIDHIDSSWEHSFWRTWVRLVDGSDLKAVSSQFRRLETKYLGAESKSTYSLQSLSDVYLKSAEINNAGMVGNLSTLKLFSGIALLIILVAAFNYIILSTAVSSKRAKEIGVRKTYGANNKQIKYQFLAESVLLSSIVLPIAILLMFIVLPFARELFDTDLSIVRSNIASYLLVYLTLTALIGFVSGFYTSIGLSRLKVVSILKSQNFTGRKKHIFRASLIVLQLVIFCFFLASAFTIRSQYQYSIKKNPGFNNTNVLLIDVKDKTVYKPLLNEIKANPNVIHAAGSMSCLPVASSMVMMMPHFQDKEKQVKVEGMAVDFDFLKTMGVELQSGRYFSHEFGSDSKKACILNETAVKQLGIEDPVGKQMASAYDIIGVAKDFNLHSFHSQTPPLMITITDKYIKQIAVHYKGGTLDALLPKIKNSWNQICKDQAFTYSTIEETIEDLYSEEKNMSTVVTISALFTMLIASFGLFGLTLFIAQSRTKEIGIKKVMGCSNSTIIYSFLRLNMIYVMIATLISVPITVYAMSEWLSNYSVRVDIQWWFFVIAFLVALMVVSITVLMQSYRTAKLNPIDAIKCE
ncbi:FtsX-like permease family protein [Ancylomarina salipaludis]|uniref:FtsX-like permease family protein n=1 Tax=Ancylomarina salipaludis TaxID=2501299 RepID=A0A4V1MZU4_9BACT|nr:ABC transporter permease [Ancylomarina salipaludis]RXQ89511.1 FtsX-like permease family protein [Ancylomarina salipaludis]